MQNEKAEMVSEARNICQQLKLSGFDKNGIFKKPVIPDRKN